MSLTLGFSILSLVEMVYFFTMRFYVDKKKYRKKHSIAEDMLRGLKLRY